MTPDSPRAEEKIAQEILSYLDHHPEAKDTLDGIAQWWLLREWSERKLEDVERAVLLLLSKDLIVETRRHGLPPIYRLNHDRLMEISAILNLEQRRAGT